MKKLSNQVKPISKLKAEAPDVIRSVAEGRTPVIVTVNGEAKAVLQDIASYEEMQESLALLKILALSRKSIEAGKARPFRANSPAVLKRDPAIMGIAEYREAHFKPYRIIYRVANRTVEVYCVLDGRRDMQALLQRRLLR